MTQTLEAAVRSETRIAGLILLVSATGHFAAVSVDGDTIGRRLTGHAQFPDDQVALRDIAEGVAIITDNRHRALNLLVHIGVRAPIIWDIVELACLLVPACPADDLDGAADYFSIAHGGSGAGAQAERAAVLFGLLLSMLDSLDTATLLHVTRLAAGLEWPLRALFSEVQRRRALSVLETGALAAGTPLGGWVAEGAAPRRRQSSTPDPDPPPLDLDDIARRLEPDGSIAHDLIGYESRPEQVHMAQLIAQALNRGEHLLVEAGTGTGKSLAYLLPAALRAVRSQRRVIVSTATTTLQDQLFQQDLPLVARALAGEAPLRATVLKGRTHYLCLTRWQQALHAADLSPIERLLLIKTLFWLPRTTTGDRAELRLSVAEDDAWHRLSAVTDACTPTRCAFHRVGVCFLARARRAAEDSHLVIANHALLLSDLVSRSRVLPDYDVLIIDEAHHLEDEATQQLGWRLGERDLLSRLERIWMPSVTPTGAVPEALSVLGAGSSGRLPTERTALVHQGEMARAALGSGIRRFFDGLLRLLEDPEIGAGGGDENQLRITAGVRAGSAWQELEQIWSDVVETFEGLDRMLVEIVADLESVAGASDTARDLAAEMASYSEHVRDVRRRMTACMHQPSAAAVHWISGGGRFRSAWINAAPIDVGALLRDRLFAFPEAVVLVSATLTIGGSFEHIKRRLGLDEARGEALGSPFDYGRAALLYVPNDLPDPTQTGYAAHVERAILDVATRLGGRTLVLFTSRAQLRQTYAAVRDGLAAKNITLLAQGIDESSRTRLLDAFRRGTRVVLFGTNAFWEGIDVVGDALSCVMVTRLPFAVPSDPIYAARAECFDDPFGQYAVPQAVLRLKQGFGRLIRARSDRGAVIVLDRRLVTRSYGQAFLRSLPPCSVKQGPVARAGVEAHGWMTPPADVQLSLEPAPGSALAAVALRPSA